MDVERLRRTAAGVLAVAVGTLGAAFAVSWWGTAAPLTVALFAAVAVSGLALLGGRGRTFTYLLVVIGVLALGHAVVYYRIEGGSSLTLLMALLGVVALWRSIQVHRAS